MDVEVRTLSADDVDAAWRLAQDAFHAPDDEEDRWRRSVRPERMHAAFAPDGRLVALCRTHAFGQFFGGRSVPMADSFLIFSAGFVRGLGSRSPATCSLMSWSYGTSWLKARIT